VPDILIVGGGVVGLGLGMILARDGHSVTVLERDPQAPPAGADDAWEAWERKGVNQFRLPHLFLARYRQILEQELPDVVAELEHDGAVRFNPVTDAPDTVTGGRRDGDDRFEMLSGRRAVVERSVASVAQSTPGLSIRRGVAVKGLLRGADVISGIPHVTGVRTGDGTEVAADLVVDCSGRRSALPEWLDALGARPPVEQMDDSGFTYLGRHFRSRDGQLPVALGGGLQAYGSVSVLTLPADRGTWSVTLVVRSGDRDLRGLRDLARWERTVRALPTVAHWLDGEPVDEQVVSMSKIEDRHRDIWPDGAPVVTGLLPVADAWACTNPSVGRGASIGMLHAQVLRDLLREAGNDHPAELSAGFAAATRATVEPWYQATLSFDRHRLAEMEAFASGATYDPGDPAYDMAQAMARAGTRDPDAFRGFMDIVSVLTLPADVLGRPGMFEKVIELGADWRAEEPFGPDRDQLVALANS
jgi:2-polyprenyl-6-methoxyphenol hydroxylase-like FAD-dependent oxidoreductase